jgi:hypothetical protein
MTAAADRVSSGVREELFLVLAAASVLVAGCATHARAETLSAAASVSSVTPDATESASTASVEAPVTYPVAGPGTFDVASTAGAVAGTRGTLLTYRVAVEHRIAGISTNAFADAVATTLADPRGWTATGRWRLQRAAAGTRYDFTIYLATPATRDVLCKGGYDRYTSCRRDDSVVLNVARWVHGVPEYGADLGTYRQYMVNHETGHRLYHGHELCTGPGRPAPVMQQQTLGLHGCVANAWPMVNGKAYAGVSGQYDDPVPATS